MTTITVDAAAGVMCSDSHWTDGTVKGPCRKVWRIKGALVGFAGDVDAIALAKAWMQAGAVEGKLPMKERLRMRCEAVLLQGSAVRVWTPLDGFTPVPGRWAIGSGAQAARAALEAGASASKAVAIARNIDAQTSGRTRVYRMRSQ